MATPRQIEAYICRNGGATVTLHGRHDLMGDQFDIPTYVVGGAKDDSGEVFEALVYDEGAWGAPEIAGALDLLKALTARHEYVYTAAGFWIAPDTSLVVDLVNTTTLHHMAKQWAEERQEDAYYELVSGRTYFTDHFRETQERLIREELMAEAVGV